MPGKNGVFVVVALAMLVSGMGLARADWAPDNCVFHHPGDIVADRHVADLLKYIESGGAARICPPMGDGETWYYKMTPISKRNGVFYYYRTRVFPKRHTKPIEWIEWPPEHLQVRLGTKRRIEIFMCGEEFSCDRHYSTAYVWTNGVSTYQFRKLQNEWNGISKSASLFDSAVERIPKEAVLPAKIASARKYIFKKRLFDLSISGVRFKLMSKYAMISDMHRLKYPYFEFSFGTPGRVSWSVAYEYDDAGIRLLWID